MMWLLSLFMGLIIAWIIVLNVNKMKRVSYYQAALIPGELAKIDDSLVAVGLAQFAQVPSIMDSINKPVDYTVPPPVVIEGSLPDPNFTPLPGSMTPGPASARPVSSPMTGVSSPAGFSSPAQVPGPASAMTQMPPSPSSTTTSTMSKYGSQAPPPMTMPPSATGPSPAPGTFSSAGGSPFLSS